MHQADTKVKYVLDNSGIIHLAALRKNHSNVFRFVVTLRESVDPLRLQQALDTITPRFPTLVAGIHSSLFQNHVVPVATPLTVRLDGSPLSTMTPKQISNCAMRVLYRDAHIAVEFFHALTDGYGAIQFLKALLAEYLWPSGQSECLKDTDLRKPDDVVSQAELEDSYVVYANGKKQKLNKACSYVIPIEAPRDTPIHTTTAIFPMEALLQPAHKHHVTLATLFAALMIESVMEIQIQRQRAGAPLKPVRIMVPVNLRNLFPSKTLRNFTLYALPCIQPGEAQLSRSALFKKVKQQLETQLSYDVLQGMMTANVGLDRSLRFVPVRAKCALLRVVSRLFGSKTSCLTLSNLGELQLPEAMRPYVQRVDVFLTPRLYSPYNCGIISYGGSLHINFSRRGPEPELERIFLKKLSDLGHHPALELDGVPISLQEFLTPADEAHPMVRNLTCSPIA